MYKKFKSAIYFSSFVIAAGLVSAPLSPAQAYAPPQKKLIHAGWERPTASDLLKHQKVIEKTPYDGIVLMLTSKDDEGKHVSLQNRVFDTKPLKLEWFADDIKKLKSFRSDRLTDNFIRVSTSVHSPDWFDDAGWEQVIENWKVAATIAKEGGLKGLCFDPEMYRDTYLYTYDLHEGAAERSFDEYRDKVRQRGREVIDAISSIYPDMVFFTFRMNDINQRYADSIRLARYNLLPAFINGWLDSAPSAMVFVDGGETGYQYSEPEEFLRTANFIRNAGMTLVAPENRAKYRAQVQVSFGIYLDAYSYYRLDDPSARAKTYALQPLNGSRLNRLQSNINAAVNAADEYVWTWGEHYRWWPTNTRDVNPETWDEILPGTARVLLQATRPELAKAEMEKRFDQLVAQGEIKNLLKNNTFSDGSPNTDTPVADWQTKNAPAGWQTWQKERASAKPGSFLIDSKMGEAGSAAAGMAGVYEGFIIQGIDVKPGEKYFARTRARRVGSGVIRLDIRWKNGKNWTASEKFIAVPEKEGTRSGEWFTLSSPAEVPAGVNRLYVLVGANGQNKAENQAWFDNVELYKIPDET